jgi:hypothetical protein
MSRTCTLRSHKGSISGLLQKLGINEGLHERHAEIALQTPKPLGLRSRQPKTGHLHILALDALQHVVDTHEIPPVRRRIAVVAGFEITGSNPCAALIRPSKADEFSEVLRCNWLSPALLAEEQEIGVLESIEEEPYVLWSLLVRF